MTKLHLVIKLNDLGVLLCDRDSELIDVSIKGRFVIISILIFSSLLWNILM